MIARVEWERLARFVSAAPEAGLVSERAARPLAVVVDRHRPDGDGSCRECPREVWPCKVAFAIGGNVGFGWLPPPDPIDRG